MGRLFTFGCSFTQYKWPTWADILGRQFDYYENWGKAGAGNQYIVNSITEAHLRNKFTPDDTIVVMWTSFLRLDMYTDKNVNFNNRIYKQGWFTPGNLDGWTKEMYGDKFCDIFINPRGCYIKDLPMMFLADQLLESIGCKKYYLSMVDVGMPTDIYDLSFFKKMLRKNAVEDYECREPLELYSPIVEKIRPSVHNKIFDYDWQSRKLLLGEFSDKSSPWRTDSHPVPDEHLEYLQKVLPELTIPQNTIDWTHNITQQILDGTYELAEKDFVEPSLHAPKHRL